MDQLQGNGPEVSVLFRQNNGGSVMGINRHPYPLQQGILHSVLISHSNYRLTISYHEKNITYYIRSDNCCEFYLLQQVQLGRRNVDLTIQQTKRHACQQASRIQHYYGYAHGTANMRQANE